MCKEISILVSLQLPMFIVGCTLLDSSGHSALVTQGRLSAPSDARIPITPFMTHDAAVLLSEINVSMHQAVYIRVLPSVETNASAEQYSHSSL